MKLVFLIDNHKHIGGGEYVMFKYAQTLAQRGHEVVIFAGDKHFLSDELSRTQNLIVRYRHRINLPMKKMGVGKLNRLWARIYEFFIVKSFISEYRPDWIVGYLRSSAIDAVRLGQQTKAKVANFIFESPPWMHEVLGKDWELEMTNKSFRRSWDKTKEAYLSSDILIPASKLSSKKCREWLPHAKIAEHVYPGFDPRVVKRKKVKYDVVYVGRLNRLKNIDEIIKALQGSSKSMVIIGGGEERYNLESLAQNLKVKLTFAGGVTDDEKYDILARTRLLVFPSSFEGFGMPPMEGLQSGCHVLCSDLPIFKEVYGSAINYFPLHNVSALKKAINKLLDKKPTRNDTIAGKYSWTRAAETIERVLGDDS